MENTNKLLNIEEKNLLAKLIRMGAVTPESLSHTTRDRLDVIVAGLPTVYECSFISTGNDGQPKMHFRYDTTPEGLNKQVVSWLKSNNLKTMPDAREVNQCTVEAWQGFFKRPVKEVDTKELSANFKNWGYKVPPESFEIAFENNSESNLSKAESIFNSWHKELLTRLVAIGVVPVLDIDNTPTVEAQNLISLLPPLVSKEVVFAVNGENERKEFIDISPKGLDAQLTKFLLVNDNISEEDIIHQSDGDIRFGLGWLDYFKKGLEQVDPSRNSVKFTVDGLSLDTDFQTSINVALQDVTEKLVSLGIDDPKLEDKISKGKAIVYSQEVIFEGEDIGQKRFVSLSAKGLSKNIDEYIKSNNIKEVLPLAVEKNRIVKEKSFQLYDLQKTLKTYEIPFTQKHLEHGFHSDTERVKNFAELKFSKALISKTVAAGLIKAIPMDDWKALDASAAKKIIASIPCDGTTIKKPGDWFKAFQNNENKEKVKAAFDKLSITFDENKVTKCFPDVSKIDADKEKIKFASQEEIKVLDTLVQYEKIDKYRSGITSEEARKIIKESDNEPATPGQTKYIGSLVKKGIISRPNKPGKLEANLIISEAVKANDLGKGKGKYVQYASQEQRAVLQDYVGRGKLDKMEFEEWKKLSFSKAKEIISTISSDDRLTDSQRVSILDLHAKGKINISKVLNTPVIKEEDINKLTFGQARKLLEQVPASKAQVEVVEKLIEEGHIEKSTDIPSLSKGEASKLIGMGFKERNKTPKSELATAEQKSKVAALVKVGKIPKLGYNDFKNLTSQDAAHIIKTETAYEKKNTPGVSNPDKNATDKQIAKIEGLIKAKKIDPLTTSQEANLTMREASEIIGNSPASQMQKSKIGELAKDGKIDRVPFDEYQNLTNAKASELIKSGLANKNPAPQSPKRPATESQMVKVKELYKLGKINDLPKSLTAAEASKIISDVNASITITPKQKAVVEKMIKSRQIEKIPQDKISKMSQGEFSNLLKSNPAPGAKTISAEEYKQLSSLVKDGSLPAIPKDEWKALNKEKVIELIKKGKSAHTPKRDPESMGREIS